MNKLLVLPSPRTMLPTPLEAVRMTLVIGCALALAGAGLIA